MDTPFIYGKLATGKNFTNRIDELNHLKQNFLSGTNTILISPRRWGKSSLVKKTGDYLLKTEKKARMIYLDMYNIRTEEQFYQMLAENLFKAVSDKLEELVLNTKEFMKQWIPKITFSPDAQQEFSLGLNWNDVKKQPDEILDLAENIASKKGIKLIVCIDEFQNLSYFQDSLAFQKKLRSHWQHHQHVTYCLYGSKRHMLMEVFTSPSMPFYKFGDLMFLDKIPEQYWKTFIVKRFKSTGKKISGKQASFIASQVKNHPYYVQQLAQLCWLRTENEVSDSVINESLESLVLQLSLLFQNITESLSTRHINFLRSMLDGVKQFSSKKTIEKYNLGTSASVIQVKKALINREIIDEQGGNIEILDPLYELWLKDYYFKSNN